MNKICIVIVPGFAYDFAFFISYCLSYVQVLVPHTYKDFLQKVLVARQKPNRSFHSLLKYKFWYPVQIPSALVPRINNDHSLRYTQKIY